MSNEVKDALDKMASDLVKATLTYTRDQLISEAQSKLKSSRSDYVNNISGVFMEDKLSGKITLSGDFPVMLEEGFGPFDEKIGFSRSKKRRKKSDGGWYLTIPYRHRTQGYSNVMPYNIKKNASKLSHRDILSQLLVYDLGYRPQTSWAGYTWRNTKYDGLQKFLKVYKSGKKHGQYVTFRRVSENSSKNSWQHPGYKGLKAFDTVTPKAESFAYEFWEDSL